MWIKKTSSVYILLVAVWLSIAGWQGIQHARFRGIMQEALRDRTREIASTLGVVIRSQRRFGIIHQSRLEAAINELVKANELQAVILLNSAGQKVASAGKPVDLNLAEPPRPGMRWGPDLVTIMDLVDLGANAANDSPTSNTDVVLPDAEISNLRAQRRAQPRPASGSGVPASAGLSGSGASDRGARADQNSSASQAAHRSRWRAEMRGSGDRAPSFHRPPWMPEDQYLKLLEKQGLHGFLLQMSTAQYQAQVHHDLWIRFTILFIALLGVGGMGMTWRGVERMDRLQLRLMRASEMNAHLQELNLAAAGLAHETRNPLNIVRGLAQLISQSHDVTDGIRQKAMDIAEEVDRVTGRLNEFINYSRSPKPRPAPTRLLTVIGDVKRALESDLAEKAILCDTQGPDFMVEADESLLRQVIFNLLLNAIQAVGQNGRVNVVMQPNGRGEASFEVRDNGPGIQAELRSEIFKPYFTTQPEGAGIGLAVVRHIVLAHHWEIEFRPGPDGGAVFRVSGLKVK